MKLLLATGNQGKEKEIRTILGDIPFGMVSLKNYPNAPEVDENEHTFEGNAIKKARELHEFTGLPTLADDSGLEVFELGMQPGVYSARFSGSDATDMKNNRKLLGMMEGVPREKRAAQFHCVSAFVYGDVTYTTEGICRGTIAFEMRGNGGFGYDCLVIPNGYDKTFGELPQDLKDRISHRGQSLAKMRDFLLRIAPTLMTPTAGNAGSQDLRVH